MYLTDKITFPGEHNLSLPGLEGQLEAILSIPSDYNASYVAILGHPHSLQGGSMSNKVVTTLARVMRELGIASLRFNFRGVGQSMGAFDNGIGESEDMIALATTWLNERPNTQFIFAGFSFGSYVAYRTAAKMPHVALITIAPPVHHFNYLEFNPHPAPWLVVQGNDDEVVPASVVMAFSQNNHPPLDLIQFENTGHFFHGQLIELKAQVLQWLSPLVNQL